jgi:hypothetical protein
MDGPALDMAECSEVGRPENEPIVSDSRTIPFGFAFRVSHHMSIVQYLKMFSFSFRLSTRSQKDVPTSTRSKKKLTVNALL